MVLSLSIRFEPKKNVVIKIRYWCSRTTYTYYDCRVHIMYKPHLTIFFLYCNIIVAFIG